MLVPDRRCRTILHPAWRILLYLVLCAILTLGAASAAAGLRLAEPFLPPLLGVTAATWAMTRLVERRSLIDLGLHPGRRTAADAGLGLILPVPLLLAVFAAEWAGGWLLVAKCRAAAAGLLFLTAGRFAAVAWYEELFARGYLLGTLRGWIGFTAANLLSALVFSGLHLANPGANLSAAAGILLAGLLLGYAFKITGSLYLPMAFHFAWNLALAMLGFPVSGHRFPGFLVLVREGPAHLTGGAFGPEAGLLGFVALFIAAGVIGLYGRRRGATRDGVPSRPL